MWFTAILYVWPLTHKWLTNAFWRPWMGNINTNVLAPSLLHSDHILDQTITFAQTRMPGLSTRILSWALLLSQFELIFLSRLSEIVFSIYLWASFYSRTSVLIKLLSAHFRCPAKERKRKRARQVRWFFIKAIQHWAKATYWKHPASVVSLGEIHSSTAACLHEMNDFFSHVSVRFYANERRNPRNDTREHMISCRL